MRTLGQTDGKNANRKKTVLFLPLNSVGHMNSSVAIADQLKQIYGHRTVFMMLGPPVGSLIQSHGHELVIIDERNPYEDYELEEGEDPRQLDEAQKSREGKQKRKFLGGERWPQVILRHRHEFMGTPEECFRNTTRLNGLHMAPMVIDNTQAFEAAIEALEPDLIVSDSYLPQPSILAKEQVRPWVRLQSANPLSLVQAKPGAVRLPAGYGLSLPSRVERERMRREEPARWQALMNKWQAINEEQSRLRDEAYESIRKFYRSLGCDRLEKGKPAVQSPYLTIYMFPEALDYDQESDMFEYPARMLRCDSLMRQASVKSELAELDHWNQQLERRQALNDGHPLEVVFFSLGSIASGDRDTVRRYVAMLAQDQIKGRLYIVSKGHCGDQIELNERNMIGANYVPQPYLLQRSHLAIIHGGNNSVTECLYSGLPMVVLPNFSDQFDNAQRVQDLGLGKRLSLHHSSAEQLLAAVEELLADREVRARAKTIGERMRQRDDLAKVSFMLDELLGRREMRQDFIDECRSKCVNELLAAH